MNSISPNIFVYDMDRTISYYENLGFKLINKVPDNGEIIWAMMNCEQVIFMFQTFESLGNDLQEISRTNGGSLLFYIQLKEIKLFYEKIKDHVIIVKELDKTFYGATEFSIQDINGYVLTFAEDE